MTIRLIFINLGVFLFLTLVRLAGFFMQSSYLGFAMDWLSGTASPGGMLVKPWTLITYMFVHIGFFHLLSNMIILYFSGRLFEDLLNGKRLLAVYVMGGIAGFLLYFAAYNLFPVFAGMQQGTIHGASASVIAILVAIAAYTPNLEVRLILLGNVKLKWIAIFFVALDILFLDGGNTGGRLAHLGGASFGYAYSAALRNGNDWSKYFWAVVNFFRDLINPKPRMKVASKNGSSTAGGKSAGTVRTASRSTRRNDEEQEKIDAILDKISRSGYDSLSKAEKEFLFKASKK